MAQALEAQRAAVAQWVARRAEQALKASRQSRKAQVQGRRRTPEIRTSIKIGGTKAQQPSYRLYNKVKSSFNNSIIKSNVNKYKTFKRFKNNKSRKHKSRKQRGKLYMYNNTTKNKKHYSLFNRSLKR